MGASESRPECPVAEKGERVKRGSFALKTIVGGGTSVSKSIRGVPDTQRSFPQT